MLNSDWTYRLAGTYLLTWVLSSTPAVGQAATTVALTTTVGAQATEQEKQIAENLLALLQWKVGEDGAIDVVERAQLDLALHELLLSTAQSAERPLELGKLASASLILTTRLRPAGNDGTQHVLVRVTDSLTGAIRGGTAAPISEPRLEETAEQIARYLSAVVSKPEMAGISVSVAPLESLGRFDRLRPLERGLRDLIVARLSQYTGLQVLQRSRMKELLDELSLIRGSLADHRRLPDTLPSRRAAYHLRGSIDERHRDGYRTLALGLELIHADSRQIVDTASLQTAADDLPTALAVQLHRLVQSLLAHCGRQTSAADDAPEFDEVDHMLRMAADDLYRLRRRNPRDFSFRDFRLPGRRLHGKEFLGKVPIDSPFGSALLHKSVDRLESVLYLHPENREAAYGLAFCLSCHIDGLFDPQRSEATLRQVFHARSDDALSAATLNLLAEMYYHHDGGRLEPKHHTPATKALLFAFTHMPAPFRDYQWTRLLELLLRVYKQQNDYESIAKLMRAVADLAESPRIKQRERLAYHATTMAQSLVSPASDHPRFSSTANELLSRWSESEHVWLRKSALAAQASTAITDRDLGRAADHYLQIAALLAREDSAASYLSLESAKIKAARLLRLSGNAAQALATLDSFRPRDRSPTSLLNGRYGLETGACLEALEKKDEALEAYLSYAEDCRFLADNSDVRQRIEALGGAPLNPQREIDVRYVTGKDKRPFIARSLATDGRRIYLSGDYRSPGKRGVTSFDVTTAQWSTLAGPTSRGSCLACDVGQLWVGTDEGLWRYVLATRQWQRWNTTKDLPDDRIIDVATVGETAIVSVGSRNSGGVVRIDADDGVHVYEGPDAPQVALYHLAANDEVVYGTNRDLYQCDLNKGTWEQIPGPSARRPFAPKSVFRGETGWWASACGKELFRLDASSAENELYRPAWFPRELQKAGYDVEFLLECEGRVWFGGTPWWRLKSVGFYRMDVNTGQFVIYGLRDGFRPSTTYECYDGIWAGGRIWLATSAGLAEVTIRDENLRRAAAEEGTANGR